MLFFNYHKRLSKFSVSFISAVLFISAFGVLAEAATIYYVDATSGNDSNDGLSELTALKTISKVNGMTINPGDSILFKRGEMWRGQLFPHSGNATGYVTYGAYGLGEKPLLLGSVTRNNINDWSNEGGDIWITSGLSVDVGNLIFNNEESVGVKVRTEAELDMQGKFWYDETTSVLKVYSAINPAIYYSNIECALRKNIISQSNKNYVIYKNLDLRYGGAHGIGGSNVHHIIVRDCDFSYIGGSRQYGELRYGNGIEFWDSSHDTIVERCRLSEIYDAALTTQGAGGGNTKYNQYFSNNVIWNSEYCFEYWNRPSSSTTDNIYFENNTCVNAGYGWGHNQRWLETDAGWHNGRHLAFYKNTAITTNFYVRSNILYEARNVDLILEDPWNGIEDTVLDYNIWYQISGFAGNMIYYFCTYYECAGEYTMAEFSQYQIDTGKDPNSLATDPLFNDIGNNDFRPVTGSPACTLSATGDFVGALPCVDINDPDGDGDGMPDSFENLYGLDPNSPLDADYDNDMDGLNNFWEYVWGTDPTNPDTDGDGFWDASDTCPVTSPIYVIGASYSSLQTAYNASADGANIQSQNTEFTEDILFDMNKSIILESGYDCAYSAIAGATTVIGNVTISDGSVSIGTGKLVVQ